MNRRCILAIDQGTTSTRAILFDAQGRPVRSHAVPLRQIYPTNGWVEHDPHEIWQATLTAGRAVAAQAADIAAMGITNQRETSVIWDRATGEPLYNAIVWQDRRTASRCMALRRAKWEAKISYKTGLRLDPYFSATKLEWLLKNVKGARERVREGGIAFGTIDSWLIWNLTKGAVHATDVTNASRTMLFDLRKRIWDADLLKLFGIPCSVLPEVRPSAASFGNTDPMLFGAAIPILGVAGDQQAASFGQACFSPGDVKSTYGTGCFALVNTGSAVPRSANRLLSTALCGSGNNKKQTPQYAIEGSIFIAGAVIQWLRDGLGVLSAAPDSENSARHAAEAPGLYFVPAFTGLGAPYWDPEARGAILGLTRDTGAAEIVRAALDSVCYQTRDLLEAMARDMKSAGLRCLHVLKVDGGMVTNNWFCQRLADLTGLAVERPVVTETTALGVAYLAGLGAGLFKDTKDIAARWALDRRFEPAMTRAERDRLYAGWNAAVKRVRS